MGQFCRTTTTPQKLSLPPQPISSAQYSRESSRSTQRTSIALINWSTHISNSNSDAPSAQQYCTSRHRANTGENHESSIARRNRTPRAHDLRASCLQSRAGPHGGPADTLRTSNLANNDPPWLQQAGFWTTIVGRSEQLTYLLAWESLAQRQEQWAAFESDAEWLAIRKSTEENGPLIFEIESSLLRPNYSACLIPAK